MADNTPRLHLGIQVIARGQGFMAVNRLESEGVAQGQGRFTTTTILKDT